MREIKNKKIKLFGSFFALSVFGAAFFIFLQHRAQAIDCDQLTGDDKDKCEVLEKKAKAYQDLIEIKNKQQNTLSNQLQLLDVEQERNKTQLQLTQAQAEKLTQQIDGLQKDIKYKEELIKYQQAILRGLLQAYYEDYQAGVLGIVLINKDFSDILNKADYIEQSSGRVSEVLKNIQQAKDDLHKEYAVIQQKKQESENLKQDLEYKSKTLQSTEIQKQTLLTQTQGEEEKYQKLLARVEQQKLELFDFSTASNLSEVIGSVSNYPKPNSKYWASSWYFSQTDSRWANMKIGGTKYLMKDYGCAITSVAMVYKFEGDNYTPKVVLTSSDFIKKGQAIIYWPTGWSKDYSYNKNDIKQQLNNGKVVIAHIKKGNTDGHFIVIHHYDSSKDDFVVNDPYFGANLYLKTSLDLMAKLGTNTTTSINYIIITN